MMIITGAGEVRLGKGTVTRVQADQPSLTREQAVIVRTWLADIGIRHIMHSDHAVRLQAERLIDGPLCQLWATS